MTKGQHGNKEAKKPKKVAAVVVPAKPGEMAALPAQAVPQQRQKRR
jgi:hypothetical protein